MQLLTTGSNNKGLLAPNHLVWGAQLKWVVLMRRAKWVVLMCRAKWGVLMHQAKWEVPKWVDHHRSSRPCPINSSHLLIIKKGHKDNSNHLLICRKLRRSRSLRWPLCLLQSQ